MTNTKNHSKYDSYVSICPRNCFSPLTWLSSLLQLLSDGDLVSLHLWRRMSEMKCSVSAQKEGKKVFNGRAENVTRDVCIAPQAHNSVLKYRCQEQAGVCIGKIRIWTWTKSPGVCVLSPTDVQGHVSWCAEAGLGVCAELLIAQRQSHLRQLLYWLLLHLLLGTASLLFSLSLSILEPYSSSTLT